MDRNDHERIPAELADVAQRLRDERPQATALELDQIKLRAQTKARRHAHRREAFMRSRLAITSVLVVGVLMSGAGAGLAVSGVSGSGSSGDAQYPTETTDTQTVLPTTETNTPECTDTNDVDSAGNPCSEPAQEKRQVSSNDSSQLPFTGYAAIPVLLIGLSLLGAGVVMRRRVSDSRRQ
jgi:hypothetical protein